jgi:hypothetical protein
MNFVYLLVFRSGTHDNRFNSKMAELLASSYVTTDNNEQQHSSNLIDEKSSLDDDATSVTCEIIANDETRVHSKLLHRRIATMLDTLRRRGGNTSVSSPSTSPRPSSSRTNNYKSQPITFGQLRTATRESHRSETTTTPVEHTPSTAYVDNRPANMPDGRSHVNMHINKATMASATRHPTSQQRLYHSPSLEQLLEQQHLVSQANESKENNRSVRVPLTVDDILATYYCQVQVPHVALESIVCPTTNRKDSIHLSASARVQNVSETNEQRGTSPFTPIRVNEQNKQRPPPPSYSSSVTAGQGVSPPSTSSMFLLSSNNGLDLDQQQTRPSVSVHEQFHSTNEQLKSTGTSVTLPIRSSMNTAVRPPPPRYESAVGNIEPNGTGRPSMIRTQAGFDREFSRLLYGREGARSRHQRQKRKAFSDPVK